MNNLKSLALFFLAAVLEIGGLMLVWQYMRESGSLLGCAVGFFLLILYSLVNTFQSIDFHKAYAVYGCVFIILSLFSGVLKGTWPCKYELAGSIVVVIGSIIIYVAPENVKV